jgi:hypothetical protein
VCSCPVELIWCSQACQHSTQYCSSRCASHALGLPRTRNTYPEHRREARGLACCYQVGTYSPHARRQPTKPTAVCHLARISGASMTRMMSEAAPSHIPGFNRGRQSGPTVPLGSASLSSLGRELVPRHYSTPPNPVVGQHQCHHPTR